jgi:hypothetical protein
MRAGIGAIGDAVVDVEITAEVLPGVEIGCGHPLPRSYLRLSSQVKGRHGGSCRCRDRA